MSNAISLHTPVSKFLENKTLDVEGLLSKLYKIGLVQRFIKKKEVPYIDSEEYKNDPVVFKGTAEEGLTFLRSKIKKTNGSSI